MLQHVPAALLVIGPTPLTEAAPGPAAQRTDKCTINALPEPQRRRLIDGYVARYKSQGKASADAWAKAQGDAVYLQLAASGACRGTAPPAKSPPRTVRKTILNKEGKPCRNIEVENQLFPGFGGEPMRMALVQVCKD